MTVQSKLYLIEFYDRDGGINFAWVRAEDSAAAIKRLYDSARDNNGKRLSVEETIKIDEQASKFELAVDAEPFDLDDITHLTVSTLRYVLELMQNGDKSVPSITGMDAVRAQHAITKALLEYEKSL